MDPIPFVPFPAVVPHSVPESPYKPRDWIELFNNSSSPLSLANCFLTDQSFFPFKWEFPNSTVIAPLGYLIVMLHSDSYPSFYLNAPLKLDEV